jgi:hypothetical protein
MNAKERFKLFLVERAQEFSTPYDQYRWVNERARWAELIFCMLLRLNSNILQASDIRKVVGALWDLGYLEIETMVGFCDSKGKVDGSAPGVVVLVDTLTKCGASAKQAERSVCAIWEAAKSVEKNFNGKIQQYLRGYGQQMMNEVRSHFELTQLNNDDVNFVFSHWLQNVLYVPIQLAFKDYVGLEDYRDLTLGDMIEVADELDINLALVDDILSFSRENS